MNLVVKIIDNMPSNLTDLEKARYIYIELGKILEFDESTMRNTEKKHYDSNYNKKYKITKMNSTSVTCNNWADIYVELLELVNIKAFKNVNPFGHASVNILLDSITIYADATEGFSMDLSRIKQNKKTRNFTLIEPESKNISSAQFDILVEKVDELLGYSKKRIEESERLDKLKLELSSINDIFDKVKKVFLRVNFSCYGFFDGSDYIRNILTYCLGEDIGNIRFATLSRTNTDLNVNSLKCITVISESKIEYYIFVPHVGIRLAKSEDLIKLSQVGYGVEGDKVIIGTTFIEKFKLYDNSKKDNIRLKREQLYLKKYKQENAKVI